MALSADGQTLAIGAPGHWDKEDMPGYVQVYSIEGLGATLSIKQLGQTITGESDGDQSGSSVSLSANGKTLAIGANSHNGIGGSSGPVVISSQGDTVVGGGLTNAGHVKVFSLDGNGSSWNYAWNQLGQTIEGEAAWDNFGFSVNLSSDGKILAVGADFNGVNNAGYVNIYHIDSSDLSWKQIGHAINGETAGDMFGSSLSSSSDGKTLAIGAPGDAQSGRGYATVYHVYEEGTIPAQAGPNLARKLTAAQLVMFLGDLCLFLQMRRLLPLEPMVMVMHSQGACQPTFWRAMCLVGNNLAKVLTAKLMAIIQAGR